MKRRSIGRYYTSGKKYSVEMCAYVFKTVVEYKKMTREDHLPSHLSKMASVSFKVVKKVIMFVSGDSNSLHKPSGHGYSGEGS